MESHSLASWNAEDPLREESWQDAEEKQGWFPEDEAVALCGICDSFLLHTPQQPWGSCSSSCPPPPRILWARRAFLRNEGGRTLAPLFQGPHNRGGREWVNEQRRSMSGRAASVSLLLEISPPLEWDPEAAECGCT